MPQPASPDNRFHRRLQQRTRRVFYWTVAWLLSTAILALGPKFMWNELRAITVVAVAINIIVGIGLIVVCKNNFNDYDELQKKVTMDAMAITLGVFFVLGIPYELITEYNLV